MIRAIGRGARALASLAILTVSTSDKARMLRARRALRREIVRSGLFDPDWYRANNYDIHLSKIDPLQHFLMHGMAEKRDPGPAFETEFYVKQSPDWAEESASPFEHYLAVGRQRNLATRGLPSYERWLAHYDDLTAEDLAAVAAHGRASTTRWLDILCLGEAGEAEVLVADLAAQVGARIRHVTIGPARHDWPALAAARGLAASASLEDEALATGAELPVLVLSVGVRLRPHACWMFLQSLDRADALAAYADHDVVAPDGRRSDPVFKPTMSPEYLRHVDYVGPVALFRRPGWDAAAPPADLVRRALSALEPDRVERVPFILYHVGDDVPAPRPDAAPASGRPAAEALPSVDIIVPTRDRVELLRDCIDSILARSRYPADRMVVTIVDNGSVRPETAAYFDAVTKDPRITVVPSPGRFNFSRINNDAARRSRAAILIFLNNDTTVLDDDWIGKLVDHAVRPGTGAVGCMLLYPDGTIQHGGVALGVQGVGAHHGVGARPDELGPLETTREMTSVTGACLAVRRAAFEAAGGFDEILEVAFNDVALCATLAGQGLRNIYVAEPLLVHHESKSRGFDDTEAKRGKQTREAIYARTRFADLFRDDPSYSPNRSLVRAGDLGFPPRVVRPWRRSPAGRKRIMFVSRTHQFGNGVPVVLAEQARFFGARGWDVTVAGPVSRHDFAYEGCTRVDLVSAAEAASYAVEHAIDCIVAHTPPFFSCVRFLGAGTPVYVFDHGEPDPAFFGTGQAARRAIDWEKRFCAPLARRVFAISQAIWAQQFRADTTVLRNGNSHLAVWSPEDAGRRDELRAGLGLADRFLVLNVCRFAEDTRQYKGVDLYAAVALEFPFLFPDLADTVVFAIAGRGEPEDVALLTGQGLQVYDNVSDAKLMEIYAAADLYMNFSRWEGYNLGIGQALAMGLPVIASGIAAHREFPIALADDVLPICTRLAAHARGEVPHVREPIVDPWSEPLSRMEAIISADLSEIASRWY